MPVDHIRQDVKQFERDYWSVTRDCFNGAPAVKRRNERYLPMPNSEDNEKENKDRYNAYKTRAIFYNVVGRTARGFKGLVFAKDPSKNLPDQMRYMYQNVDGENCSIDSQAGQALIYALLYARGGFLVNYPHVEGGASVEDVQSGKLGPRITLYEACDIINWRITGNGSGSQLTLLVLREKYAVEDDSYETKEYVRYRELRIVNGVLVVKIWDTTELYRSSNAYRITRIPSSILKSVTPRTFKPTKADATNWEVIPFQIFGADSNDFELEAPPLFDMALVNLGHYVNSADHEESSFMVGQPTYYIRGLTQRWVDENMKKGLYIGSRRVIPLPEKGEVGLVQADPNTLPGEGMKHKEQQMIALGAKLVENAGVARTATETSKQDVVDNSILAVCARNINAAYARCIEWCCLYIGIEFDEDKVYELSDYYETSKMTAQERQQLLEEFISGAIDREEYRTNLKQGKIAWKDDDKLADDTESRKMALESKNGPPEPATPAPNPGPTAGETR